MTDHSDLIAQLQAAAEITGDELLQAAADALSSQSLSLSEAREEIERLKGERDAFLAELGDVEVAGWSSAAFKLKRVLEACEENEKSAEKERDEAVAELCRWRSAFQRVTPGGSEFFDPKAVRDWADMLKMQVFEANKRAVLAERKALENGKAQLADATNDPADLSSLRKGAEVVITRDMIAAAEIELVDVLRGFDYFMPADGMERVLKAALVSGSREGGADA